jgi:uncharacterized protein YggE
VEESKIMRRLAAVLVLAVVAVSPAAAQSAEPASIVTRGTGVVTRAPEVARFHVVTTARAEQSTKARKDAADAMTDVRAKVKAAGVPDTAIRTLSFVVQPDYAYVNGEQRFRGYQASNSIEIRLDDVTTVATVIDAAGSVNLASIDQLEFDVKDRKAATEEALRLAVADAMSRARAMAGGAGKAAGDILKVQEEGVTFPEPFNLRMNKGAMDVAMAGMPAPPPAPSTPITPGPIEITARVVLAVAIR